MHNVHLIWLAPNLKPAWLDGRSLHLHDQHVSATDERSAPSHACRMGASCMAGHLPCPAMQLGPRRERRSCASPGGGQPPAPRRVAAANPMGCHTCQIGPVAGCAHSKRAERPVGSLLKLAPSGSLNKEAPSGRRHSIFRSSIGGPTTRLALPQALPRSRTRRHTPAPAQANGRCSFWRLTARHAATDGQRRDGRPAAPGRGPGGARLCGGGGGRRRPAVLRRGQRAGGLLHCRQGGLREGSVHSCGGTSTLPPRVHFSPL